MAKLPDISEITKKIEKIDIQGFFDNVKTAFNNATGTPSHPPLKSELIAKCQTLQEMMHSTLETQSEVNDQINQLKHKIAELARDIQAYEVAKHAPTVVANASARTTTVKASPTTAAKTAQSPASAASIKQQPTTQKTKSTNNPKDWSDKK